MDYTDSLISLTSLKPDGDLHAEQLLTAERGQEMIHTLNQVTALCEKNRRLLAADWSTPGRIYINNKQDGKKRLKL